MVPFYKPRSNPDGFAVTVHCIDPGTVRSVEVRFFDGQDWEGYIAGSGIQALSKTGGEAAEAAAADAAAEGGGRVATEEGTVATAAATTASRSSGD